VRRFVSLRSLNDRGGGPGGRPVVARGSAATETKRSACI